VVVLDALSFADLALALTGTGTTPATSRAVVIITSTIAAQLSVPRTTADRLLPKYDRVGRSVTKSENRVVNAGTPCTSHETTQVDSCFGDG
jgi:hypothetical protein